MRVCICIYFNTYVHFLSDTCLRVGSNGNICRIETYVFLMFPTYVSSSFGSNWNIYISRVWRLQKTLIHNDGAIDIYIYYIVKLSRLEGSEHMLTDQLTVQKLCWTSRKLCEKCPNLPRHTKEVPVKHIILQAKTYISATQNICFGAFDPALLQSSQTCMLS